MFFSNSSSNGSSKGSSNNNQPLVQWSEVPGHPGLVYCMTQSANNPVILMIKPSCILLQEIKVQPAKAKVSASFLPFYVIMKYDEMVKIYKTIWNFLMTDSLAKPIKIEVF